MNLKEVIKTLELAKAEVEWNYPMDYAVAIDEAIKAIDKQIPKKPEPKKDASGEYYVCPICGVYQEYLTDGKPPYCVNCGEALDWQEVEE